MSIVQKRKVLYFDAYNIFYQHLSKNPARDPNAEPIGGFVGTVNAIQKIISKFGAHEVYVVFDGLNAGFRRRKIDAQYKDKRGRKTGRAISIALNDEQTVFVNNEDYQMSNLIDCLKRLPVKIITAPYYEADDLIAFLVAQNQDCTNIICSTDKDYLQLVNDNTYVWSIQKKVLYDKAALEAQFKVKPENFLFYRTVIGDSSDKLIGVKGFKEKTLFELFPAIQTTPFESIGSFIEAITAVEGKGKKIEVLHESKEQILTMHKLMHLSPDYVSLQAREIIEQQIAEQTNKVFSKFTFKQTAQRTHLIGFLGDYDIWARPFSFLK